MTNWLSKGMKYDAIVSNNDEMAVGAIQALKAAGVDTKAAIVGGVDATQDALGLDEGGRSQGDGVPGRRRPGQGRGRRRAEARRGRDASTRRSTSRSNS